MVKKTYQTEEPCIVCGTLSFQRTYHHIYTRKARPALSEKSFNLVPVCFVDHAKFHAKGMNYMAEKYPSVKNWLLANGWELDDFLGKWINNQASF